VADVFAVRATITKIVAGYSVGMVMGAWAIASSCRQDGGELV
jgi:hypothetical protein